MKDATKSNGLEIAENVLVWGSVAGTLVSVVVQQTIYATAPISLALLLNLSNRRRFEQKLVGNMTTVVSDVSEINSRVAQSEQELAEQMQFLKASVQESIASKSVNLDTLYEEIAQLQTRLNNFEGTISNLTSITTHSDSHSEPAELITTFDPTYLEQQIEELKTALFNKQQLEKCEHEIQELKRSFSLLDSEFQAQQEQQQIEELRKILE